jgi:hypothetical protein
MPNSHLYILSTRTEKKVCPCDDFSSLFSHLALRVRTGSHPKAAYTKEKAKVVLPPSSGIPMAHKNRNRLPKGVELSSPL